MTKQMKMVSFSVTFDTIGEIIEKLKAVKKSHPEINIMESIIDSDTEYDCHYVSCTYKRYETEEECNTREHYELARKKQKEEWDRKQFEALKKKFGD